MASMNLTKVTVVTPCYNEEDNVEALFAKVKEVMATVKDRYEYEHLFIDNHSQDRTVEILRRLSSTERALRVIVNSRNFGHIRSPAYALLQAKGDVVISLVADFQDPPEMILAFLAHWEKGAKIVMGVKESAEESPLFFAVRKAYYNLVSRLSDVQLVKNFTGFGLYDQKIIKILREIDDPYPYWRGLISDIGFEPVIVKYKQPVRKRGLTKNNFYTLYDIAMLGITNHSKVPLRVATMAGFAMSALSLLMSFCYLFAKLIFWNQFQIGTAPILISLFFFSSLQLFFIGILGEYIGSIHTQVQKRPLVVEKERIGFGS